jgi:hypothetical protein
MRITSQTHNQFPCYIGYRLFWRAFQLKASHLHKILNFTLAVFWSSVWLELRKLHTPWIDRQCQVWPPFSSTRRQTADGRTNLVWSHHHVHTHAPHSSTRRIHVRRQTRPPNFRRLECNDYITVSAICILHCSTVPPPDTYPNPVYPALTNPVRIF